MNPCRSPHIVEIPGLDKIPLLKYLKEPVSYKEELYDKYPHGGEEGWFMFVHSLKTFVFWDIESKDWGLLNLGSENVTQIRYMMVEQEMYMMSPRDTQTIRAVVYDGYNREKTNEYSTLDVERNSNDYYSDQMWNQTHGKNKGFEFTLAFNDLNFREGATATRFTLIAQRGNNSLISNIEIR